MNKLSANFSKKVIAATLGAFVITAAFFALKSLASEPIQNVPVSFLTEVPEGYRDWKLISVAHEEGKLNDIRAILGNDIAIDAYRKGQLPFPDGAIIARLAWSYVASEENNKVFGQRQSFVAGPPTNGVQFMLKDSKKFAATGGWGYGHFENGVPAGEKLLKSCYPCHEAGRTKDFVFTHYSP
jgi:hypothetical protein